MKQLQFDTNSIDIVIDNSANIHICNQRLFLQNFKPLEFKCGINMVSKKTVPEGIGEMDITQKDDNRFNHKYTLQGVLFYSKSLVNIFGVTKFTQFLEGPNYRTLKYRIGIKMYYYYLEVHQDKRKYSHTIIYPLSSLPVISFNTGFRMFESFCISMENINLQIFLAAFVIDDKVNKISDKDLNLPLFLSNLLKVINNLNLTEDKKYYIREHNCLNYLMHTTMIKLAEAEEILKCILKVLRAPACTSCLFRKAYK